MSIAQDRARLSRRGFIFGVVAISGGMSVGCASITDVDRVGASGASPGASDGPVALNAWLRIATDGRVTVSLQRAEMGQGVSTILPLLVAEELDCDWQQVGYVMEDPKPVHANVQVLFESLPFRSEESGVQVDAARWVAGQAAKLGIVITGGSTSVRDAWMPLRLAGASARRMLVQSAASRWGVDVDSLWTDSGVVIAPDGRRASYGELVATASVEKPPTQLSLKSRSQWKLLGKSVPRIDVPAKTTGAAIFGADVRLPGQLYAAVMLPPSAGARLLDAPLEAIRRKPGVVAAIKADSVFGSNPAVVIVADNFWAAREAAKSSEARWVLGPAESFNSASYRQSLRDALELSGTSWRREGRIRDVSSTSGLQFVEATYETPFLAHAALETHCCTAIYRTDDREPILEVWAPTQLATVTLMVAADAAGLPKDAVRLHPTLIGGGFGYKGLPDTVVQAVVAAKALPNRPVQVQWTREQDLQFDTYRPAAAARLGAWVDSTGKVVGWRHASASASVVQSLMTRALPRWVASLVPDKTNVEGAFDKSYDLGVQEVDHRTIPCPLPVGFWRSVGHSHQAFFVESFVDEVAHSTGQDPLAVRRRMLAGRPRELRVLDAVAEAAGWGRPIGLGKARGLAFHESFGSICAQVAEVARGEDGLLRVERVFCAVDCGIALHPDMIKQQMEGGVIYGLTAALFGEVSFENGRAQPSNFDGYPLLTLAQSPTVQTVIVDSGKALGGIGEVSTPPIAPAVANAIFVLTGQRTRSLPLATQHRFA